MRALHPLFTGCGIVSAKSKLAKGCDETSCSGWRLFPHGADVGVCGFGPSLDAAFEAAGCALTAAITDPDRVDPRDRVDLCCQARDDEVLFVEWLNALVYEMATRGMLFGRFAVHIEGHRLHATAWGEPVNAIRHEPAAEVKGATFTELKVAQQDDGSWLAQCVVDV